MDRVLLNKPYLVSRLLQSVKHRPVAFVDAGEASDVFSHTGGLY